MSIPNICHFCYATALFGPVKSTLKSAQVRNKIANISPAWQKLRYRPLVSNISFGNETTVKKVKSQLWFGWILWTDKKTLRLMLRFLVVWAAWGKWVSAVKMWSSLNVSLSWPMLLLVLDMCWSPYVWSQICVRQEHKNNTKLASFGLSWPMQSMLLLVLEICWICTRQEQHKIDKIQPFFANVAPLDLALPDMCACYTEK